MKELAERSLLNSAYEQLDFVNGELIDIDSDLFNLSLPDYLEKSQWIETCKTVNKKATGYRIEKVFFCHNSPVILFVNSETPSTNFYSIFNEIWSVARPRLAFISNKAELNIYDLASKPTEKATELTPLETITEIAQIASKLQAFSREGIETGKVFGDERFKSLDKRADIALINDLKQARNRLYNANKLDLKFAHALIGRAIFIRYLEDRGIITRDYFYEIAHQKQEWVTILNTSLEGTFYRSEMSELFFPRVLQDKDFTYALFDKISQDFNGDTFPTSSSEKDTVTPEHIRIIQEFLIGGGNDDQSKLFFWAYRFDIIPLELISSIYEEFYHTENREAKDGNEQIKDSKGTHYTPSALVEFVLSRVLTAEVLNQKPRVLDPACGSGIFLVETFRRIVRHQLYAKKRETLEFGDLLEILKNQIAGIELNPEAIRIAAFSLYLAVLHYQNPPDILEHIKKGRKLPYLIFNDKSGETHLNILLQSNAFNTERVSSVFPEKQFDVIVGNPPWGSADKKKEDGKLSIEWFAKFKKPTSDNEYSQMFLWLASELLKENGVCGMLVSSGILLKNSETSNKFKQSFLQSITLQEVGNFIHTRHIFFKGADSPFLAIKFQNKNPSTSSIIHYWTFRQTKQVENTEVVVLDKNDFKFFRYSDTHINDIWKTYYWGNQKDLSLINSIRINEILESYEEIKSTNYHRKRRQGYIVGRIEEKKIDSGWLKGYKAIKNEHFESKYGSIDFSIPLTSIPDKVKETGQEENYYGLRLLIKDGIASKGYFISRLEEQTFAFRDTINCIRLESKNKEDYKIVLAILWSSLSRYFYFMTTSRWGVWHDDILLDEILKLPIVFPENKKLNNHIISLVDSLREGNFREENTKVVQTNLYEFKNSNYDLRTISELEIELDEAIFELYNLTQSEIDLVKDRCKYDVDFFYNKSKSIAVQPIPERDAKIASWDIIDTDLKQYVETFSKLWNAELEEQNESLHCEVFISNDSPMLALAFSPHTISDSKPTKAITVQSDSTALKKALTLLEESTNTKYSDKIYIEGIIRAKTSNYIFIIKRNQKRLWSKTEARIDAEATMLLAI